MNSDTTGSAYELVATLSRIADMRQRSYALAMRLNELDIDNALEVLELIRGRAFQGDDDFRRLHNSLLVSGTLVQVMGQEKIGALVDAAQARLAFDLVAFLMDLPQDPIAAAHHQPFLDGGLREVPLGMRKSLARKPDFKLMQRIARDQDHRVIEHLLNNPRLTEKDVIRIGATRPTSPKVLEAIYNHPRWITRYAVKKVIVFNPYSPLSIAMKLLAYLRVNDLEDLCDSHDLSGDLLAQAQKALEQKTRLELPEISLE